MGTTRFQHTVMGGSRLDGPIIRPNWFDWVFSRVLWPCLIVTVGGAIFYLWVRLCEVTLWRW